MMTTTTTQPQPLYYATLSIQTFNATNRLAERIYRIDTFDGLVGYMDLDAAWRRFGRSNVIIL